MLLKPYGVLLLILFFPFCCSGQLSLNVETPQLQSIFDSTVNRSKNRIFSRKPKSFRLIHFADEHEYRRNIHKGYEEQNRLRKAKRAHGLMLGGGITFGLGIGIAATGAIISSKEAHPLTSGFLIVALSVPFLITGIIVSSTGVYYHFHYRKYLVDPKVRFY